MATIKPIEAKTIHQIQSGQVIVGLSSVVKELVENSIDAGATSIEVRFKNQGLDAIEVQDNGSGISKENYDTLALKHYTSKLSTYSDLESLETFGFRGEALSSLCALSKFSVITCLASDAPKGSRLEFETSGKLRHTSVVAAQKGTTVLVENLFHNLPVRRRELERNIKREWNKVLIILNQYACIQTGLKFSVSQQPNKGRRMVLFSTKGNQTTRENIMNVFGAKTLTVLIPLDLELELEPTMPTKRFASQGDNQSKRIRVRGHVSRPAYGEGRQTPDRQMFFVNGRPCGLPQFAKVFNEVYKSYNASQSPFIFADIQLDTHLYDVNVSPDKRTILLHDQTRMLDNLRESLSALFDSQDYALPTSQLQASKQSLLKTRSSRQDMPSSEATTTRLVLAAINPPAGLDPTDAGPISEGEAARIDNDNSVEAIRSDSLITHRAEPDNLTCEDSSVRGKELTDIANEGNPVLEEDARHPLSPGGRRAISSPSAGPANAPDLVTDFRARLEGLKNWGGDGYAEKPTLPKSFPPEPPIPDISPVSRATDINVNETSVTSAAKRPAPEVATITIGDRTVTSIIGSVPKKQRLDSQQNGKTSTRKSAQTSVPVPSFNGRLTQMFAAQSERSSSDKKDIVVTSRRDDNDRDSDSASEKLFVTDESEGDTDNEDMAGTPSGGADQKYSSQNSKVSEAELDEASGTESASPTDPSDVEYRDDDGIRGAEGESNAGESIENAQAPEETIPGEPQKRTDGFVRGRTKKRDATYHLQQTLRVDAALIRDASDSQQEHLSRSFAITKATLETDRLDAEDAEAKLSLTISKSDFDKMKIIGQFNLGFILASRAAEESRTDTLDRIARDDELFIIDQHATDEKYNFERLQANTVVQSQRLVHAKTLELTAVEEDIVQQNLDALESNGFEVRFDGSGDQPVGTRCELLSLPLSRETTFSLADLEELISLLQDHSSTSAVTVPRPSKVRKMFAMRACRSSVMIGKSLSTKQMEKLVRHMGELDKPWNCPHGRPTMRHLCGLGAWDELAWKEGDGFDGNRASNTDWSAYLDQTRVQE